MPIRIIPFVLGPIENNSFLVFNPSSHEAIVIDPSFEVAPMLKLIDQEELKVVSILITHAHFDHIAGVGDLMAELHIAPKLALHAADLDLWKDRGGAGYYGFQLSQPPDPDLTLSDGEILSFDGFLVNVLHAPGHTPGHVIFSIPAAGTIFTGDLIFAGSIGRTDLPGGDYTQLIDSIRRTILTFPDDTHLLSGHGPGTTVGHERQFNPYLK
jgi:hydroxyacylglutathione hydrolase